MRILDRALGIDVDFANPAAWANPYPLYAWMREASPMIRCRQPFVGRVWAATRYEDVSLVLKDPKRFKSSHSGANGREAIYERVLPQLVRGFMKSMVSADGDDHRRLRGLVAKAFTPARIEQLEARIDAIATQLLDRAIERGTFDLMAAFAVPLPLRIISELLGVEEHERAKFRRAMGQIIADRSEWSLIYRLPTYWELRRMFERMLARKRARPTDDLTSDLIAVEQAGDQLTAEELLSMVFLLLFAGHETTVNLLGNGTLALLEHPEQFERLRDDPALVPLAIEEMLRFDSPAHFPATRYVAQRCEVGGMLLQRGDKILPLLGAANRDARAFDDPDVFDVGRDPNRHVAFGAGPHFCVGAHLSRFEGRIALTRLVQRCPGLRLAVGREALRWRQNNSGLRGLAALPVRVS
ncbi:putative cytochrome P450 hydroxylase [Enhygromyxa salina]|uniref:Putative cytochrome P450 hydroxylase n=1 Tax=Enhygromyxa salina TaxID=215803 RepID=A0A0C1ZD92_9BACT|nr:cytochrome P450 [Enhygromyxa salina]KIG15644.1 putative cytochrome P450 hydroxylase [Enhygromyxa salina]